MVCGESEQVSKMYQDKSYQTMKGNAGEKIYRASREGDGLTLTHMYKDFPRGEGVRDVDFLCQNDSRNFFGEVKAHDLKTFHGEQVFFLAKKEFARSAKFARQQKRELEFAFVDSVTDKVYIASAKRLKQVFERRFLNFPMDTKTPYGACWVFHIGQFTEVRDIPAHLISALHDAQIPRWDYDT